MLKNEKGITLIALIITIIVMLILVGVTINVALNGGLFSKTEQATRDTEEKAILEEMLAMMEIDDNGKFKPDEIIGKMKTKYEIDDSNKPNITIKGKLGTYKYIVSETEIKIGEEKSKGYTFTLNQLGEWTAEDDAIISFNLSKLWEVIGEDLSSNSEYLVENSMFLIESKNSAFGNYYDIATGTSKVEPDMKFLLMGIASGSDTLMIKVADTSFNDALDKNPTGLQITFDEFFRLYGNTEFEIVKPTPITAKAYLDSNQEYCYIFYSNGIMEARVNSTNASIYRVNYKLEEESKELTINGVTSTYKNRVYAERIGSNDSRLIFTGYFSDSGSQFIGLFGVNENEDGSYTGDDWETCTLDPDREI